MHLSQVGSVPNLQPAGKCCFPVPLALGSEGQLVSLLCCWSDLRASVAAEGPQGLRRVLPLCGASPCVLRDREEQQDLGYEAGEASGTVGFGARGDWGLQSFSPGNSCQGGIWPWSSTNDSCSFPAGVGTARAPLRNPPLSFG